jgi:hypothetical protein
VNDGNTAGPAPEAPYCFRIVVNYNNSHDFSVETTWSDSVFKSRLMLLAALFAGVTLAVTAQTPEKKADDKKPAETKPEDKKPADAKPADTKPADPKATTPPAATTPPMATTPPAATTPPMGTTPPAATTAPAPTQQFGLKLEKNKAFFQKLSTTVQQTIKVQGGADLVQKHEQVFFFKWLPTDQVGDKWTVKQTIEGAKMTIDIAGNQVKYDSTASVEGAGANPGLADFFSKLVGSEFTITFGKGMAIEKVDGREEFLKKLGGINNQMESILKKLLTEEALKQMIDPTFGIVPSTEVALNGTWEKPLTMTLGPIGSYELKNKYTYKGKDAAEKEMDRIEVASTLVYKAPAAGADDGLLFKIKGGELKSMDQTDAEKAKNFVLYDPKAGRIAKSSLMVKMKGTLNVSIGGTDTTVDLYQEQTTAVETKDTTFVEPKK